MAMDDPSHPTSHSFLTNGSQVEVTSNQDHGFNNGAWYAATVLPPPPSTSPNHHTNNVVYVEYHNIFSEDASSTRLREHATISYVRPAPVPDPNPPNFQLNDLVDAFYRDGWWTGVVTNVVDSVNFVVTFRNPPDEIQFCSSDLRVHKKWVNGSWVQHPKQVTAGWMFTIGKKVEVSFESSRDVWFPATILKNSGNSTFLVEYQQPEGVVYETVDYHHIRPSPPHLRDKNYVLGEKVDAYYDFGWWCGVLTKELADNRYNVFFNHTKKELEFSYSKVRPHMEWKGGKWFKTSQGDTAVRTTHSLIDDQNEQQSLVATTIMKRKRETSHDSNDKDAPNDEIMSDDSTIKKKQPSVGQPEGVDSEASRMTDQAFVEKGDTPVNTTHSLIDINVKQSPVDLNDKTSPNDESLNDDSISKKKQPSDGQPEGVDSEVSGMTEQTDNLSHGKKVHNIQEKNIELKTPAADSSKKKGKYIKEIKMLQDLTKGLEMNSFRTRTQKIMGKNNATKNPILVVMGLQCHRMTVLSQEKTVQNLPDEETSSVAKSDKQPDVPLAPSTVVDQEGSEGDAAIVTLKRKRGRPPKVLAISPKTPATVNHVVGSNVPSALSVVEAGQSNEVGLTTSSGTASLEEKQGPVDEQNVQLNKDGLSNENTGQDLLVQQKQKDSARNPKRGKRQTISIINAESPPQDSQEASKEKSEGSLDKDSTKEASVGKSLDTMSDDQPIASWFVGKHSSMDDPEGAVEQSSKASEEWLHSGTLPFIKSASLWETLGSMEAFRKLPQNPHFRPLLEGVSKGAQEGLAIGTMITFSTMFDKTCSLGLNDPTSTIKDCLETLVELENNGFDVKVIRERLTGLLLVKAKHEKLEEQSNGVVEKIEENEMQGTRIEEEIEEMSRRMRELEERRKYALLKEEKRILEMGVIEAVIEGIKEEIREVGAEFGRLVAVPFVV